MSQPYVGEIRLFAGNFAPSGWMFCEGQLLPISEYESLFNLIGTTYGGDGQTTFALPDLRSRIPIHQGQGVGLSTYALASSGGLENVALTVAAIASHTHNVAVVDVPADMHSPVGSLPAVELSGEVMPYVQNGTPDTTMNSQILSSTGSGQAHGNLMPYLNVNFILSLFGIFPAR